jgi:hypothetical protein
MLVGGICASPCAYVLRLCLCLCLCLCLSVSICEQARSSDAMAQRVEDVVLLLASRLVSAQDRRSLEAKHVALSLNALADWCLGISSYFLSKLLFRFTR